VATGVPCTTVCRRPVSQTTSCPSSSVCPSTERASIPCGGRDGACLRVGTGAVDPAREQAGAPSCCGRASGQRPWCHYTSSSPGSHGTASPIRRTDMSAPIGTGHDMSAPSAGGVLVGAPRRARCLPPGTCCDAPWWAGIGLGRALAQNLHKVGPGEHGDVRCLFHKFAASRAAARLYGLGG
jgi:hypothetical protein